MITKMSILELLPSQTLKGQIYSAGHSPFLAYPSSTGPHSFLQSTCHVPHLQQDSCISAIKAISRILLFSTNNTMSGKRLTRLQKPTKDAWCININCRIFCYMVIFHHSWQIIAEGCRTLCSYQQVLEYLRKAINQIVIGTRAISIICKSQQSLSNTGGYNFLFLQSRISPSRSWSLKYN